MRIPVIAAVLALLVLGCSERRPSPAAGADTEKAEGKNAAGKGSEMAEPKEGAANRIQGAFSAQVAGGFYPADPAQLRAEVQRYLDGAGSAGALRDRDLVGILAPHAGYRYSGPVAGESYRAAMGRGYKTVVVLALSHRRSADKVAILDRPAYDTPLGSLAVDRRTVRRLIDGHGDLFAAGEEVFLGEHSLEVQLPFVQVALPEAKVVPIVVACHDEDLIRRAGEALFAELGNRKDVLFAVSSDLSHFFPYGEAQKLDNETLSLVEKWDIAKWKEAAGRSREGMCGFGPMLAFIGLFEKYGAAKRKVTRLAYKNSGDTTGEKDDGVVGYGSLAFSVEQGMRQEKKKEKDFGPYGVAERRYLMDLAKRTVAAAAHREHYSPPPPVSPVVAKKGAAFVTLKKDGDLRGCIGHVIARIPLYQCINDVAESAAIHDTRFNPLTPEELASLSYEISVLTAPEPTTPDQVVVGRDGLIMSRGYRSGLLLPQVPVEWGWDRVQFLAQTCHKAGLPPDCWRDPETKIESFRAIVWGEGDLDE